MQQPPSPKHNLQPYLQTSEGQWCGPLYTRILHNTLSGAPRRTGGGVGSARTQMQQKKWPNTTCLKCQSPLNNTHILGGCRHTSTLRTKRHNNTFLLLHQLLKQSNGGRCPVIGVDLRKTPVMDFSKHIPKTENTTPSDLPLITHPENEGLQDDKKPMGRHATLYRSTFSLHNTDPHIINYILSEQSATNSGPTENSESIIHT